MSNDVWVELYKLHENVPLPSYGTTLSACFDLCFFPTEDIVSGYDENNNPVERFVLNQSITIDSGDRLLIPTGLVMKVRERTLKETPEKLKNYSIRLHPRSGLSLKRGLVLANSEGIVDVDYQLQIFALMTNISKIPQTINVGERVCQGEIVTNHTAYFLLKNEIPTKHSERNGGFGSTGTAT